MTTGKADNEIIHINAESYFDSLIKAINRARISIDLESYIFSKSPIADSIVAALVNAVQRGVIVRVIVDGVGVDDDFLDYAQQMRTAGIGVRIYHPLPWHLKYWPFSNTVSEGLAKFWFLITSINKRNHRKTAVIDQQLVWLGSFNVCQVHFPVYTGGENWRDTGIELRHCKTQPLNVAFNHIWYRWRWHALRKRFKYLAMGRFILNINYRQRRINYRRLIRRIVNAKSRIWIANAYFVPNKALLRAIMKASSRNVDVRILLPSRSDVKFMPWISSCFYEQLLLAGARIYEYQPSMMHSKTLLIDDWATIGSSNFNRRSLSHDLEVDYVLQHSANIRHLEQHFSHDLEQAQEETIDTVVSRPKWQRLIGLMILSIFGYWI